MCERTLCPGLLLALGLSEIGSSASETRAKRDFGAAQRIFFLGLKTANTRFYSRMTLDTKSVTFFLSFFSFFFSPFLSLFPFSPQHLI